MIPYRLTLVCLSILISLPIFSQTYIGVKGGVNLSKANFIFDINPSSVISRTDHLGYHFSIPIEIKVNEMVNFMPEVAIVSEGTIFSSQIQENQFTYNNSITYLKFPLMGKLKLLKSKQYEFGIVGGVVPAIALNVSSFYFNALDWSRTVDLPIDFSDAGIKRFDLAVSFGLNTEKAIANGLKIILDLRYNLGMLNIENGSNLTNTTESFSLTLGILTPLFKKQKVINL